MYTTWGLYRPPYLYRFLHVYYSIYPLEFRSFVMFPHLNREVKHLFIHISILLYRTASYLIPTIVYNTSLPTFNFVRETQKVYIYEIYALFQNCWDILTPVPFFHFTKNYQKFLSVFTSRYKRNFMNKGRTITTRPTGYWSLIFFLYSISFFSQY